MRWGAWPRRGFETVLVALVLAAVSPPFVVLVWRRLRVRVRSQRSVHLSEYLQWYAKDFGPSKREALKKWCCLLGQRDLSDLKIKVPPLPFCF